MWVKKHIEDPVAESLAETAHANGNGVSDDALDRVIDALAPRPERLSDADLSWFAPAFAQLQEAQCAFQAAQQAVQEAQVRAIAAQGAMQYVFGRLQETYFLAQDDEIDKDGVISRKARVG